MSDPHQATSSSVSLLLESLLGDVDDVTGRPRDLDDACVGVVDPRYNSSSLEYLSPETELGASWAEWDDVVDFGTNTAGAATPKTTTYTQSEVSEITMRKKRKRDPDQQPHPTGSFSPSEGGSELQQRQRGKNWEKAEEDVLVEGKSRNLDWKAVSERLQEHGFTRNHKHCADKWYALRKHYLELEVSITRIKRNATKILELMQKRRTYIHQWMVEHPGVDYWDRISCTDRIRSVPPSFCQKWYQIFDAAENREGRKSTKVQVAANQRRKLESAGTVLDSQESLGFPGGELLQLCPGDSSVTLKMECHEDAYAASTKRAVPPNRMHPNWNVIEELVTEIQNLRRVLTWRFEAEENERSRNLAIQEKKLELKRQRFEYQRRRDEELR